MVTEFTSEINSGLTPFKQSMSSLWGLFMRWCFNYCIDFRRVLRILGNEQHLRRPCKGSRWSWWNRGWWWALHLEVFPSSSPAPDTGSRTTDTDDTSLERTPPRTDQLHRGTNQNLNITVSTVILLNSRFQPWNLSDISYTIRSMLAQIFPW